MARTITEIQQSMLDAIAADTTLAPVATNSSKTGIFRLFTYIVAAAIWTVEVLMDTFRQEVSDTIAAKNPHTTKWYAGKVRAFQYGYNLPPDSDVYDNTGLTEEQIDASLIIKYSAINESNDGRLLIKIAGYNGTDLAPVTTPQLTALTEYMGLVKDAGVKLVFINQNPDNIKLDLIIYYNPLVLNETGQRIDGTSLTPVHDAVQNFLVNQPFNGVFVLAYLVDALQQVDGVVIPHINQCQTKYGGYPFTSVNVQYTPDAGYLRFASDSDLTITYIAQTPLKN